MTTPTTTGTTEENTTTTKGVATTESQDDKPDSKQTADANTSKAQDDIKVEEKKPDGKKPIIDTSISIEDQQLGIWKLQIGVPKTKPYLHHLDELRSSYPLLRRLATDIYHIAPRLFVFFMLCQMWRGVEDALLMHLSSSLLRTVEIGLITGHPDTKEILLAIAARLLCSLFVAYFSWHGEESLMALRSRVTCHFDMFLMKAKLRVDLPTSQEAGSQPEGTASDAWSALEEIISFLTEVVTTVSHLALIAHLSKQTGGPVFAFLCVSKPVFDAIFSKALWNKVCFGYVNNAYYRRMKALEDLAGGGYRQDVISGNLSEWILKEYQKSYDSMGEVHVDHPFQQYDRRESPFFDMVTKVLGDSPMIYCALCAIIAPSKFSVASIAILQQSSTTLRYSLEAIFRSSERFRRSMTSVKNVYASSAVTNTLNDGQIPYPPPATEKSDGTAHKGMSFDLKSVSFSYPGSQKSTPALDKISLSIPPGQLIVIVGSNGSGKSTLVRILSRLYDPSSGQVFIDRRPSGEYRMHDLHQATAILSQDNLIYPLSFSENIGLGFPEMSTDVEMIKEAAMEGGAEEFMGKLKNGVETTLDPMLQTFSWNLYGNKTHPLHEEMEKMEKTIDISGGERQRIVASRSFMRFKSGKVKFVAVDEPSSALDAEGELQLFQRLIAVREGKTMVFVTHRFGHLTKHADQIICMKDGSIAEIGTHEELLGKKGEYAKLYDIQASAFTPATT